MPKRRPVVIRERPYTLEELAKMSGFTRKDVRELDAMAEATRKWLETQRTNVQSVAPASGRTKPTRRPAA